MSIKLYNILQILHWKLFWGAIYGADFALRRYEPKTEIAMEKASASHHEMEHAH